MSTTVDQASTRLNVETMPTSPHFSHAHVSQWRAIQSEGIKFFSLKSNVRTVVAAALIIVGFALLAASVMTGDIDSPNEGGFNPAEQMAEIGIDPTALSMAGMNLAVLVLGTTGVLIMSGEYSSGMIRVTTGAVPKRLPVLWAKAIVLIIISLVVMTIAVFTAFFTTQAMLDGHIPTASISDPHVLRALIGNIAYLVCVSVIGLSLGTLLRSAAAGISTLAGMLLIIPGLLSLILPSSWAETISPYLPSSAGQAFMTVDSDAQSFTSQISGDILSPTVGALVVAAWTGCLLVLAAFRMKRKDV